MLKNILLFIIILVLQATSVFGAEVRVENIFSDISENYEYRDELQALYDRGMIFPDASGRFNPDAFLNRDEFVGIAMEVICTRCISPNTEYEFIEKYFGQDIYFDIDDSNRYFYCVAEADDQNTVRGYDLGQSCQDGTSRFGERPFCPLNRINLEEAVAVLLRNSGIFTIEDNARVVADINAGIITDTLGNDVSPLIDGNPYTFYGYLQKALSYEITEFDDEGNSKNFSLLEADELGNINPQKQITKEEFLKMSYIALRSNNCSEISTDGLALKMNIWEKTCSEGQEDCTRSDLQDPDDTYDFEAEVEGVCESGIDTDTGYIWRFQNVTNGEQEIVYGEYQDDYILRSDGEWRIYLRVLDRCGNTSEVYSTIFVGSPPETETEPDPAEQYIDVDIDVYDDPCNGSSDDCREIDFDEENPDNNIFDFDADVYSSYQSEELVYDWTFTYVGTGKSKNFTTEYVDNFFFDIPGEWLIYLEVTDPEGNTGSEQMTYIVEDISEQYIDVDIDVFDDDCIFSERANCSPIDFDEEAPDNDTFDFDGDVRTSCTIEGISYNWTFTNTTTGDIFNYSGEFIDDILFGRVGVWNILLEVQDGCGNTGSEQMTYIVEDKDEDLGFLDIDIDVYDDDCTLATRSGCREIEFENEEDDGDNIFDFGSDINSIYPSENLTYYWTFTHEETGEITNFGTEYVEDFFFDTPGVWNILLEVTDPEGNIGSEQMTYIVEDKGEDLGFLDIDIDVYDDDCTLATRSGCREIEFESEEDDGDNIFDFGSDVNSSYDSDELRYDWTFTHEETGSESTFTTEYVEDFYFDTPGEWTIVLEVSDPDGNTGSEQMIYIVYPDDTSDYAIDVTISADPIYGYEDLFVGFDSSVGGGTGPYIYNWDFDDGEADIGESIDHIFDDEGIYEVELIVTDINGETGSATVVIVVLDNDDCLSDSDNDGIVDCDDLCPLILGDLLNEGCPILELGCDANCGCPLGYSCTDSDPLTCGSGVCEPDFKPVASCLFRPSQGAIFGSALCNSCPCDTYLDFVADIRECDVVFPAITSPDGSDIYSRGNTWQIR